MVARAEQDLETIRALLKVPTPDNFQSATQKLESLVSFLSSAQTILTEKQSCDPALATFLRRLPAEMARIKVLLEAPLNFFRGMKELRAQKFGSYDSSGNLKDVDLQGFPAGMSIQL